MPFLKKTRNKYHVCADYQKWKGKWIHYSQLPTLKVNPQQFHQDPAGIYFFPENYKTVGAWSKYRYKFVAEVPDYLRVLDLAKITDPKDSIALVESLKAIPEEGKKSEWPEFKKQIEEAAGKDRAPQDAAWEYLQRFFMGKPGLFNKRLRQAGYDAVFDDTGSIHSSEVQLLVLDPTKVQNVKRVEATGTGYDIAMKIFKLVEAECKRYGTVKSKSPKKEFNGWDKANQIAAQVSVYKNEEEEHSNYAVFEIVAHNEGQLGRKFKDLEERKRAHAPAQSFTVSLKYSQPDLKDDRNRYSNTYYKQDTKDVNMDKIKEMVAGVLNEIFVVRQNTENK